MSTMLELAQRWAVEAGSLVMNYYQDSPRVLSDPNVKNFTTELDVEIQRNIRQHIAEEFPEHAFLGEEEGQRDPVRAEGYTWVVDPLDGTLNFYFGVPLFGVAIGVLKDRVPHIGVIYDPVHNELYAAERSCGDAIVINVKTGLQDRLAPAHADQLHEAIVMTHITTNRTFRIEFLQRGILSRLAREARHIRMLGSGQIALAYMARGRFHAFVNNYTNPWDVVAGHVIVESAGGIVTDIHGQPWTPESHSVLAACSVPVHTALVELMRTPSEG